MFLVNRNYWPFLIHRFIVFIESENFHLYSSITFSTLSSLRSAITYILCYWKLSYSSLMLFLFCCCGFFFLFFLNVFIYIEGERRGGEEQRGRHRIQCRLQSLNCQHRARCGAQTHELWDHDLSQGRTLNRLSHPGTPVVVLLLENF